VQAATEKEVTRLLARSPEELLSAYEASLKATSGGPTKPGGRKGGASYRPRARPFLVIGIVKKRAKNCREAPACVHPQFLDNEGSAYCEVHHVIPLAEDGPDFIENVVCRRAKRNCRSGSGGRLHNGACWFITAH